MPVPDGPALAKSNTTKKLSPAQSYWQIALTCGLFAITFCLLDYSTIFYQTISGISPWYPPVGLSVGLLLVFGLRYFPLLSVCVVGFWYNPSLHNPFYIALIVTAFIIIYTFVAWLLKRLIRSDLREWQMTDAVKFICISMFIPSAAGFLGASLNVADGLIKPQDYFDAVRDWWIGDALGLLSITPLVLLFHSFSRQIWSHLNLAGLWRFVSDWVVLIFCGHALVLIYFLNRGPASFSQSALLYSTVLSILCASLRYNLPGAIISVLAVNTEVIILSRLLVNEQATKFNIQLFVAVMCITGLMLGTALLQQQRSVRAVRKSEQSYRNLIEQASDGICISDEEDNHFLTVNNRFCQMLGYSAAELLNMRVEDVIAPENLTNSPITISTMEIGQTTIKDRVLLCRDGSRLAVEVSIRKLEDRTVQSIVRDVSQRHQTEKTLRENEQFLRSIYDGVAEILTVVDVQAGPRYVYASINSTAENIIRRKSSEIQGQPIENILSAAGLKRVLHAFDEGSISGQPVSYEEAVIIEGQKSWWLTTVTPLKNEQGQIYRFITNSASITRLKQTEELLQIRNAAIEASQNAILIIDAQHPDRPIMYVNPAYERQTGFSHAESVGKSSIYSPGIEMEQPEYPKVSQAVELGQTHSAIFQSQRKDGSLYWRELNLSPVYDQEGHYTHMLAIQNEISDRIEAEAQIRRSEAMLAESQRLAHIGSWEMDVATQQVVCSDEMMRLFGYSIDDGERNFTKFFDRIHPEDAHVLIEALHQLLENAIPQDFTVRSDVPERGIRIIEIRGNPVKNEQGNVARLYGTVMDVTERQLAKDELAAEKERLTVTLRSLAEGVITVDTEGRLIVFNRMAESLTGWSQSEASRLSLDQVFTLIDPITRQNVPSPLNALLHGSDTAALQALLVARDNSERLVEIQATTIYDREGRGIGAVLVFRDITEQQRMTDELVKASKLESLGILAGGIAHDFNNMLTAMLGNISLAKLYSMPEDEVYNMLDEAEKAALRTRDLTQQLLTFARGGAPIRKTASLPDIIQDSAQFVLHGSKIQCQFNLAEDLWAVEVDKGQLSQVIQNMVLNAMQAMPGSGVLQVQASNVRLGDDSGLPLPAGRYVKMSFRDYGLGIPPENLAKIFDPYFTTKEHGNGLGLAICYSVIKQHEGHIEVQSEVGHGTTFTVYLPKSTQSARSMKPTTGPLAGQGRILVMDDDLTIQKALSRLLAKLGYEVELASDGAEAIQIYRTAYLANRPFAAVIMDLTIPGGMGGKESVNQLLKIDPEVKVIVSSGYSNDPVMANHTKYGFSGVVAKPYRIEELGRVLHDVLEQNSSLVS